MNNLHPIMQAALAPFTRKPCTFTGEPSHDYYDAQAKADAADAECDRIWRDALDLQGALKYHGIDLSDETCHGLVATVRNPGGAPPFVLSMIDDLDKYVKTYVEER